MKQTIYFLCLLALLAMACESTFSAPAALSARVNTGSLAEVSQKATESPQSRAFALGKVWIRECPSTGCKPLGYIEAGGSLSTVGAVIDNNHPDCQHWQPVKWQGATGYICADYLEAE